MKISTKFTLFMPLLFLPHGASAVEFSMFGDVVYSVESADENVQTFTLGQVDLIADQEIGDATFVTTELVFEDPGHGFEVDVERFHITRTISPMFNIGMGRYHTPLGIWNHNFHHGSLIQDTITRPFFIEFEDAHGGIFPSHIVGLRIHGESEAFSYQLGIANSNGISTAGAESHPGEVTLEVINSSDPSNEKAAVGRIAFKPNTFISELGIFYMTNNITEVSENDADGTPWLEYGEVLFDQQIFGFDLRYTGEKYYVLSEFYYMSIDDNQQFNLTTAPTPNPDSYNVIAYFIQAGFHFTDSLTAVARFESLDFDDGATYLNLLDVHKEDRVVLALNYKLQSSNAIRLEVSQSSPDEGDSVSVYGLQWYFLLF